MRNYRTYLPWILAIVFAILFCISLISDKSDRPAPPINPEYIYTPVENSYSGPEIILATTTITGYYSPFIKTLIYDGDYRGTTSCDAFIITDVNNSLAQNMLRIIDRGNTVNSVTDEGLRINILFDSVPTSTKNKIIRSSKTRTVDISMAELFLEKSASKCGSFVKIME